VVAVGTRLLAVALMFAVAACAAPDPLPGYAPASAAERALVLRTVEDYYAMRERAAVSGDLFELYAAYPELARNVDRRQGINNEGFLAELARMAREGPKETAPRPITRMWHRLEIREPIGVYVRGSDAVAFVHGMESFEYLGSDAPSSGEIFVRFDLRRFSDRWVIERTDELKMGELPPRTPKP
jgi:hypothetical protein